MSIRRGNVILAGAGGSANPDEVTINLNSSDKLQALGTINKNLSSDTSAIYNWIGTLEEYNTQNVETLHPEWVCYITDDMYDIRVLNRNIGQIVQSTVPLTDAGLHLLDGSLIQGNGAYADFVTYIASLVSTYPDLFETEANWQSSATTYGACDKFVYDSVNNTVRLPKRTSEHGELIKSYSNGTEWYRIYSDGWCEQGGLNLTSQSSGNNSAYYISIPLLVEMADNNYTGFLQANFGGGSSWNGPYRDESRSTTSTAVFSGWVNGSCIVICRSWMVCGYADISGYQYSPLYEYICIANTTNTQVEIDINQVMTDVNAKVDKGDLAPCHVVIETYSNGTSWYRLYDDGWCEQGQRIEESGVNIVDVYFLKSYASVPILLTSVCSTNRSTFLDNNIDVHNLTTTGFTKQYIANVGTGWCWQACGYIS